MRPAVRINVPRIISFIIIAIVIAGVVNVYADAGPIERMARARVCERHGPPCKERLGRVLRTPFFHDLDFTDGGKQRHGPLQPVVRLRRRLRLRVEVCH